MVYKNGIDRYEDLLSPLAQKSSESLGRRHPETPHPFRNPFQRDRDRVVYCRAFRRLECKTQVLMNALGDHYRTRMTHSIEVALISRSLARALGLHEDLAEAIALAHDLGHPPFGHAGEAVLNRLMSDDGGFEHNRQSLRIVDVLENPYPRFPGMNLTFEVRSGLVKHRHAQPGGDSGEELPSDEVPLLEAQVVDVADEVTYSCNDLEDALTHGYVPLGAVRELGILRHLDPSRLDVVLKSDDEVVLYHLSRSLIDRLVRDLVESAKRRIEERGIRTRRDVTMQNEPLVRISGGLREDFEEFRRFLLEKFYRHPDIVKISRTAEKVLTKLFTHFEKHPGELPESTYHKIGKRPVRRVVCDYIAGMTDRYARQEYRKRGFR